MENNQKIGLTLNKSKGDNLFKIYLKNKQYDLKIEKSDLNIMFTIINCDHLENYSKKFSFEEIQKTPCFKLEENIDELYSVILHYILNDKIKIYEKEEKILIVFESEFNNKNLKSEFIIELLEIDEKELIYLLKDKIGFLIKENKAKNEQISELTKQNRDNVQKIDDLYKEIVKIKDIINQAEIGSPKNKKQPNLTNKKYSKKVSNFEQNAAIPLNDSSLVNYESEILTDENEKSLFIDWFEKNFTMELLYSSTKHGEDVSIFHEICDGQTNTLTLIKTSTGRRLGGFTYLKISSDNEFLKGDGNDFIFSLDRKKMFKNNKNQIYALYNNSNMFTTFGYPSDIYLHKHCFKDFSSYSSFPSSYGVGVALDEIPEDLLAGAKNFKASIVEVFKITFDN